MLQIQVISTNNQIVEKINSVARSREMTSEPIAFKDFDSFWKDKDSSSNAITIFDFQDIDLKDPDAATKYSTLKGPKLVVGKPSDWKTPEWMLNEGMSSTLIEDCDFSESFLSLFLDFGTIKNLMDQWDNQTDHGKTQNLSLIHEMKNSAAIIRGKADRISQSIVTQNSQDPWIQDLQKDVSKIINMTKRLTLLTNDLATNTLGKPIPGAKPVELEKAQLLDIFWEVIEESLATGTFEHIEITEKVDPSLYIKCHKDAFVRCFVNLLKNSFEAIEKQTNPWVKLEVSRLHSHLRIEIVDSGNGIKDHEEIFKTHYSTKKEKGGSGLGLGIVSDYLKSIGGTIQYKKKQGNTSFEIVVKNAFQTSKG